MAEVENRVKSPSPEATQQKNIEHTEKDELVAPGKQDISDEQTQTLANKARNYETRDSNAKEKEADMDGDHFIMSAFRASKLEEENAELKQRLANLGKNTSILCDQLNELFDSEGRQDKALEEKIAMLKRIVNVNEMMLEVTPIDSSLTLHKNAQLQVKVELETERRLRIQAALDDAEKRSFAANRALEKKSQEVDDLKAKLEKAKEEYDIKVVKLEGENARLDKMIREKEAKIKESKSLAKGLSSKAEEFEELFNEQLEVVKGLHSDLNTACEENKALVKEMEMLNEMFNELERTHIVEALKDYQGCSEVDLSDAKHKDDKGKVVGVHDILKTVSEECQSSIQDSCFNEVMTKNGTRMVLSVSKTFMKLKDLILEKKTLEDQVEKMRNINNQLSVKVNTHEAKLFNITDELNKTWDYVSTIKLQHKKLHTSEQILRAELLEKRQILNKLREELEYSRQNWLLVKQKTADSEREWKALREEFKSRRNEITSSESGFSDTQTEEEGESSPESPQIRESSSSLPDVADVTDVRQIDIREVAVNNIMTASTSTIIASVNDVEDKEEVNSIPIFIPSMTYMADVPPDLLPPLFGHNQKDEPDNYHEIYNRLLASTARSALLVSRLAEVNRTLGKEDEISMATDNDDDDEDVEPRTEDEYDDLVVESPDLVSEVTSEHLPDDPAIENDSDTASQASDVSLECPFPDGFKYPEYASVNSSPFIDSPPCSPDPAIWEEEEEDDNDDTEHEDNDNPVPSTSAPRIPTPPPPPPYSIKPPPPTTRPTIRPNYDFANEDSVDSSSDDENDNNNGTSSSNNPDQEMESAAAVTSFLIKHLPKQMSKLRNDKAELEEKIQDLETRVSQQSQAMGEMERRMEVHKREAELARQSMSRMGSFEASAVTQIESSAPLSSISIPLVISQHETIVRWIFTAAPLHTQATVEGTSLGQDVVQVIAPLQEIVLGSSENNCPEIKFVALDSMTYNLKALIPAGFKVNDVQFKILLQSKEESVE